MFLPLKILISFKDCFLEVAYTSPMDSHGFLCLHQHSGEAETCSVHFRLNTQVMCSAEKKKSGFIVRESKNGYGEQLAISATVSDEEKGRTL